MQKGSLINIEQQAACYRSPQSDPRGSDVTEMDICSRERSTGPGVRRHEDSQVETLSMRNTMEGCGGPATGPGMLTCRRGGTKGYEPWKEVTNVLEVSQFWSLL